ncbi:ParA family protein [Amycolatopsis australiensis]|uniref:Cellulose biosynthesis protein BcsQ n=1 Tax=Amycolatopsis australiensis TaxID=546364 RepID=A0A1K1LPY5_9PSEU|nr:AAA family ATPase [Amycolatopsis australiensis]SFW12965.1 Cellulose biosynthesis protein BcsQ [Amycolatopsis australiensis]
MRASSLVAQLDADGVERFRVTKPVDFTLTQAAYAMHAVVDPDLAKLGARANVGKSRVPLVLRAIAREGWPPGFRAAPDRVAYWRQWLIEQGVFTIETPDQGVVAPMTDVNLWVPDGALYPKGYTFASLNQKGGVGKTALTAGTAGALAARGRRVLLIDLDPQGHLTTEALGKLEVDEGEPDIAAALSGEYTGPLEDLIISHSTHPSGGLIDIVPTTLNMMTVVKSMYRSRMRLPELRLLELLDQLPDGRYDHIGLDCPPALDVLTDNALAAAKGVLIPVELARTSLRALRLLLSQIAVMEEELRLERRDLLGLVPGLFRRPLSGYDRYIGGQLEAFGTKGLPILAHLPAAAIVKEAWMEGRTVPDKVPNSTHAAQLNRIAVRLDVKAGLAPASDWDALEPLPSLGPLDAPRKEEAAPHA